MLDQHPPGDSGRFSLGHANVLDCATGQGLSSTVADVGTWPLVRSCVAVTLVGGLLGATSACRVVNDDVPKATTSAPVNGAAPCPDVVFPLRSPIGVEVSVGYSAMRYGFDESGELMVCVKGPSGATVTVLAPEGVEVTPPALASRAKDRNSVALRRPG